MLFFEGGIAPFAIPILIVHVMSLTLTVAQELDFLQGLDFSVYCSGFHKQQELKKLTIVTSRPFKAINFSSYQHSAATSSLWENASSGNLKIEKEVIIFRSWSKMAEISAARHRMKGHMFQDQRFLHPD